MTINSFVKEIRRYNYPGERQTMVVSPLDGRVEPIYPKKLKHIIGKLIQQAGSEDLDYIIGLDSGGIIPGHSASDITDIPLIIAYKAELEVQNQIHFLETHSANPDIFIYNLPENSRVMITDDEIRTGETVINCINSLVKSNHHVGPIIIPIESTKFGVREKLKDMGYELTSYAKHEF
ncbi:phosphoribosyltransferase domain-containing protein [candidate division KSB1 bacterium]